MVVDFVFALRPSVIKIECPSTSWFTEHLTEAPRVCFSHETRLALLDAVLTRLSGREFLYFSFLYIFLKQHFYTHFHFTRL